MENIDVQFFTYSAFTEATRQVKEASAELQRSFAQERAQRTQEKTKTVSGTPRARQAAVVAAK